MSDEPDERRKFIRKKAVIPVRILDGNNSQHIHTLDIGASGARLGDKSQPTADQQKENKSDREIAKEIRQSIVKDKSLSTYGHNVKIIVQNGVVTLKGPVRSDEDGNILQMTIDGNARIGLIILA